MTKDTLITRCIALGASERLDERQIGWTGRWSLMGDFVVCTQCLEAQSINLAHEPFGHLPECVVSPYGEYPWHELQQLLSLIPPLPKEQTH